MQMLIWGLIAGTLTTSAFVPQLIKAWKTKTVRDVSLGMTLTYSAGAILWIFYGLTQKDYPIVATNAFGLTFNLILSWFKIKFK